MNKWLFLKEPMNSYNLVLCNSIKTKELTKEVISYDIRFKVNFQIYKHHANCKFDSDFDGKNYKKNFIILDDLSNILDQIDRHKIIGALFNANN